MASLRHTFQLRLAVAFAACARRVCLALINYDHERNQNLTVSAILSYIQACFCQQVQTDISRHLIFFLIFSFHSVYKSLYTNKITQFNEYHKTLIHRKYPLCVGDIFSSQRDIRQRYIAPTHPIHFYKTKTKYQIK